MGDAVKVHLFFFPDSKNILTILMFMCHYAVQYMTNNSFNLEKYSIFRLTR